MKKFQSDQRQRFQNERDGVIIVTQWFQSQAADYSDTGYKSWSHGMTNVLIPEVKILKNSSTLAVSVALNVQSCVSSTRLMSEQIVSVSVV